MFWNSPEYNIVKNEDNIKRSDKKESLKINFKYIKQKDWKYLYLCKYLGAENAPQFNVIQGVPQNMTVTRWFKGSLCSLK